MGEVECAAAFDDPLAIRTMKPDLRAAAQMEVI